MRKELKKQQFFPKVRNIYISVPYREWGFYLICSMIFIFLVLPVFVVIPVSFSPASYLQFPPRGFSLRWYQEFLSDRVWVSAILLSIRVAIITMILATLLGTMASIALIRGKFKGKKLMSGLILSPRIVPIIITAVGVYFFFSKLHLIGNSLSLILAHTILALPFVVINVSAALKGLDETFEWAAMSLGANRLKTFTKVTFPLIRTGVISGALFAFITSFDEVVIAIFICGARAVTLPKHMWDGIRQSINPTIAAVSTILVCFSIVLILTINLLEARIAKLRKQEEIKS